MDLFFVFSFSKANLHITINLVQFEKENSEQTKIGGAAADVLSRTADFQPKLHQQKIKSADKLKRVNWSMRLNLLIGPKNRYL